MVTHSQQQQEHQQQKGTTKLGTIMSRHHHKQQQQQQQQKCLSFQWGTKDELLRTGFLGEESVIHPFFLYQTP
jgi:hypothetical protein